MVFFIRIKVYNALVLPHLLYGSETWTLRKKDKNDWHQSTRKFPEELPGTSFLTTKGMTKF
jgi:hypothetical protein